MQLSNIERYRLAYGSYVLADTAIVFMATPKVACTSFKHLVATLSGIDVAGLPPSLLAAKTPELAIHDREIVKVPSLLNVSDKFRSHVLTSNEYLRFCVVRNPFSRLASAWLDRILLQTLSSDQPILNHFRFPQYIPEWSYLRYKFSEFVEHLFRIEFPNFTNHHWQRQHDLLLPHIMNYNLVLRLEELPQTLPQVIKHVERRGVTWPGLPRMNSVGFKFAHQLYTVAVARKVATMYEVDFCKYDYSTTIDTNYNERAWLPDIDMVLAIQKRNRRISYLSLKSRGL